MCAHTAKSPTSDDAVDAPRVLILFGSPRRGGYTGRLLDAFLEALPAHSDVTLIDAFALCARPCDGCGLCATADTCRFGDLQPLMRMLEDADFFVMATPVYFFSFPAPLKAIVDRMQIYWSRCFVRGLNPPVRRPKRGVALITAGSHSPRGPQIVLEQVRILWSLLHANETASVIWTGTDDDPELPFAAAQDAARRAFALPGAEA